MFVQSGIWTQLLRTKQNTLSQHINRISSQPALRKSKKRISCQPAFTQIRFRQHKATFTGILCAWVMDHAMSWYSLEKDNQKMANAQKFAYVRKRFPMEKNEFTKNLTPSFTSFVSGMICALFAHASAM
jgi:hypothetical protein